jgi:molecular chaperone DnaK
VTFDIDANGILHVSAKDLATNREQKITITSSSGLSKEEVQRLQQDADAHAEEDRKRLAEVEARNRLDTMIYSTEKLIRDNREKLSADDVNAAEAALEEGRKAMNEQGVERLNAVLDNLTRASHRLAEALYKQAAPGAGAPPPGEAAAPTESKEQPSDVIDAEYVDVDDKKVN